MYNLTKLAGANTIQDIVVAANEYTLPTIPAMGLISIGLFFVLIMVLIKYGFANALMVSGFIMFMLTALLSWGGMVPMIYPFGFLAITAFTYLKITFTGE